MCRPAAIAFMGATGPQLSTFPQANTAPAGIWRRLAVPCKWFKPCRFSKVVVNAVNFFISNGPKTISIRTAPRRLEYCRVSFN
jgi:hypothetical protein